jgi:hypothetical protein
MALTALRFLDLGLVIDRSTDESRFFHFVATGRHDDRGCASLWLLLDFYLSISVDL